jgi:transposase-like protein
MTKSEAKPTIAAVNELFSKSPDGLREIVRAVMQEMLEAEMTDAVGAEKGERTAARLGYRSGYYTRTLVTRVGKLELRVPQDRDGRFSTELFERYQRSEQALVATLAEMYVQGVSTRKVKAITEELCGHSFSASAISAINKRLDESLDAFANRPLAEPFPYLILDARYEKVRDGGVVMSQAVLIAIAIDWDGRRQILAVEMANRESRSSWKDFLLGLRRRGLTGVEFVVADDHAGLRSAVREVLAEAAFQRCYVHFLRNALDHLPRKADDDCLQELRWLYDRRSIEEARQDLAAWIAKWGSRYPKLVSWVEETIEETLTFYRLPRQHHKHLKSTNMLERFNEEIRRRTYVVRIFPNSNACCRLIRALAVETQLARGPPLPQHERSQRAQENPTPPSRLTAIRDRHLQNLTHRTPNVRLIWCGTRPGCAIGLRPWIPKNPLELLMRD